jgi:hypothetical protein
MDWVAQNWHIPWGLFCLAVFIGAGIYFWRNSDAKGARIYFWLVPFSDPTGRTPTGLTRRAVILWFIGLAIVLLAILFVPGFA